MKHVDLPGVVLWFLLVLGVGLALTLPEPNEDVGFAPMLTWRITDDAPAELHVPPGTTLVKLILMAEARHHATAGPMARLRYDVDAVWQLDDGSTLPVRRVSVDAGRTAPPAVTGAPDAATPVLDPRVATLEVPSRHVRSLRLTVPSGGTAVRMRAFRDRPLPVPMAELALVGTDTRDALRFARRLGLTDWADVGRAEAPAVAVHRWEALRPRRTDVPLDGVVTAVVEPTRPAQVRRASGSDLPAGRAQSWLLRGPVNATLVGVGPIDALRLEAVAEGLGEVEVATTDVGAPSWAPEGRARRVVVPVDAEVSLTVHHDAGPAVRGLLLLIDGDAQRRLPPSVEASPVASLVPEHPEAQGLSVIPPWVFVPVQVPSTEGTVRFPLPGSPTRDVVRVSLRPLRPAPDAAAPQPVHARVHHADGHTREVELAVPYQASRIERIGPVGGAWDETTWVAEPVNRFVHLGPEAISLELLPTPGMAYAVSAASPGPLRGARPSVHESRTTRRRYDRDTESTWTTLVPTHTPSEMVLWASPRHELLPPPTPADLALENHALTSVSSAPPADALPGAARELALGASDTHEAIEGEVWLVPPAEEAHGLLWCGLGPSSRPQPLPVDDTAVQRLGGVLAMALHAPRRRGRPTLGDPWSVSLDGVRHADGRVRTEVLRRRRIHGPVDTVTFEGPRGARLWVRTWLEQGQVCADPRRPRRVVPLAPGETRAFTFDRTLADHLVLISGLGDEGTTLRARVVAPQRPIETIPTDAWTRTTRKLTLVPRPEVTAMAMDTPSRHLGVLAGGGLRLKPDLGLGPTTVHVQNTGDAEVLVHVSVQRADDDLMGPSLASRVRR